MEDLVDDIDLSLLDVLQPEEVTDITVEGPRNL